MGYVYWVVNPRRRPRADGSLLGQLEAAFRRLDQGDTLIALDLGRIGYPPLSFATMSAVRELLADPNLSYNRRDQLWRDLIYFARRTDHQPDRGHRPGRDAHHPNNYQLAAIGLAMPGLRHAATYLTHQHPDDHEDIHTGLVTAFLTRLATLDLTAPNIAGRLIGGATSAVRRHLHQQKLAQKHQRRAAALTPTVQGDHAPGVHHDTDMTALLHRAPLDDLDRQLIELTRLRDHTLAVAARMLGISITAATSRRHRAERRLAEHLRHPTTAQATPQQRPPEPPSPG